MTSWDCLKRPGSSITATKRNDGANARHGHESLTDRVLFDDVEQRAVGGFELSIDCIHAGEQLVDVLRQAFWLCEQALFDAGHEGFEGAGGKCEKSTPQVSPYVVGSFVRVSTSTCRLLHNALRSREAWEGR